MGSKTSSQQQQASSTSADPQAVADYNQTINRAKSVSNTPYSAYTGELTAPVNGQETTATNALNGLGATANSYFGSAAQQSGLSAAAVNPSAVNSAAIQQYESPYQSQVINSTEAELNQQDAIQQQQQTSNAIGAGAFGGDRAGIASAALAGQQNLANNATIANLNNTNYSQALGEANTQQATNLSASQANRSALQTNAQTLAGIGSAATTAGLGVANSQLGAGALQQQTQQASDTANYGQFEQAQAYPFQTEQYLANIVEGIAPNYGSTSTGTTTTQTSPVNSIIGGGIALGGLLSDRRAKESIKKIGKTFDGQTMYSFRYKDDPSGVTHVGLMAQDVEKKNPGAVGTLGDLKTVDYAEATRKAASKGRFATGGSTGSAIGSTPYSDIDGYVPSTGLGASAHMMSSSSPSQPSATSQSSTSVIPNFTQFATAGTNAGNALGTTGSLSSLGNYVSGGMNSVGTFNFAEGGKVIGLAAARARRGYDGGGVVTPDDLMFDPAALGSIGVMQPGVGAVPDPTTFAPPTGVVPPAQPQAAPPSPAAQPSPAPAPAPAPQGLGPATNDNTPVPVAPAPVTTPIVGYQQPNGTVTPVQSPVGTPPVAASPAGLGAASSATNAPGAINSATLPRSVRNNNPGNIVDGTYAQGLPGYAGSDGRFAVFKTPDAGSAAMDGLLSNYGAKGLNTPLAIVSKWAPAGDGNNNPAAYAASVAKQLGIGVNDPIDMSNPQQRGALAKAMAGVEAGTGGGQGSVPSSALGYTSLGGAQGGASQGAGLGAANASQPSGPTKLSDYFGSVLGGSGTPTTDHSGGVLGLFPGISDEARMGIITAGLGMMASPSKSPGMALGQGGLQGVQQYMNAQNLAREKMLAQSQAANTASEIATRQGSLGLEGKRVDIAAADLQRQLEQTRGQLANESQNAASTALTAKSEAALRAAEIPGKIQTPTMAGVMVTDPNNPTASPKLVPYNTLSQTGASGQPQPAGAQPSGQSLAPAVDPSGYVHPPTQVPINPMTMSPEGRQLAVKNAGDTIEGARTAYESSQSMKFNLDQMQHEFAALPKTGFLSQGPGQQQRAAAVNSINSVLRTMGVSDDHLVTPDAVGATEKLKKLTNYMGFDLAKSLGGREPGFIVQQSVGAVPSSDNSPLGAQRLVAGLRATAQRNEDRYNFLTEWQQKAGGDITGADDAFNKANPPSRYVGQAVLSTVDPRDLAALRANASNPAARAAIDKKYGAGTAAYAFGGG